jgi:tRNA dimethylallyltransferase
MVCPTGTWKLAPSSTTPCRPTRVAIESTPAVIAILGPTGVGKSSLAMELAQRFDGEIISADSRQIYRYLDIGTEKASTEDRARVTHHLIDIVDPDQSYSVVDFRRDAEVALAEVATRGRTAFLVGGSGYYARAFLQGRSFPQHLGSQDDSRNLEAEVEAVGVTAAVAEIRATDPTSADRLEAASARRVAHALAWIRSTGQPVPPTQSHPLAAMVIGLNQERTRLYARLDARVERQVAAGLARETQEVLARGYSPWLPVLKGLAYGEMQRYLHGEWTQEQATQAYKFATHRLVRRQLTWFRKEPGIDWVDVEKPNMVDEVGQRAEEYIRDRIVT